MTACGPPMDQRRECDAESSQPCDCESAGRDHGSLDCPLRAEPCSVSSNDCAATPAANSLRTDSHPIPIELPKSPSSTQEQRKEVDTETGGGVEPQFLRPDIPSGTQSSPSGEPKRTDPNSVDHPFHRAVHVTNACNRCTVGKPPGICAEGSFGGDGHLRSCERQGPSHAPPEVAKQSPAVRSGTVPSGTEVRSCGAEYRGTSPSCLNGRIKRQLSQMKHVISS